MYADSEVSELPFLWSIPLTPCSRGSCGYRGTSQFSIHDIPAHSVHMCLPAAGLSVRPHCLVLRGGLG